MFLFKIVKTILRNKEKIIWKNTRQVVKYGEYSDNDKEYILTYDKISYELKELRMQNYNRYKNSFANYITSIDDVEREVAKDLLNGEFNSDKCDIEKIAILK